MNAHQQLQDVADDEWSDPVKGAVIATKALLELTGPLWTTDGLPAAQALRTRRPDSPMLLAVTEVAIEPDSLRAKAALGALLDRLKGRRWAMDLVYEASQYTSLGVLSLGVGTMSIIEGTLNAATPELRTSSRAFRRGLLQFVAPVSLVAPETAACLLLPVIGRQNQRIWTTPRCVKTAQAALANGNAVLPLAHPMTELSPLNRQAFRPASHIIDMVLEPAG